MTPSTYAKVGRKQFEAALRRFGHSPEQVENIMTAYIFAKEAHRYNRPRKDGKIRYFEHPKTVAWMAMQAGFGHSEAMIIMALLHDVLEDSELFSVRRLRINFGNGVVHGVQILTKQPEEPHDQYAQRVMDLLVDWRVQVIKLLDRLHNLRTLDALPADKQAAKLEETRLLYQPHFDRICNGVPRTYWPAVVQICNEIELLCA
jgi:guanosine-3',5'-bis(diphosphate) 3'-pyrophosphohydrolase